MKSTAFFLLGILISMMIVLVSLPAQAQDDLRMKGFVLPDVLACQQVTQSKTACNGQLVHCIQTNKDEFDCVVLLQSQLIFKLMMKQLKASREI